MRYAGKLESRGNAKIISACALCDKKNRDGKGLFFFEGIKLLGEAMREDVRLESVFATSSALEKYGEVFSSLDSDVYEVSEPVYEKLTRENSPQGIFCVAEKPSPARESTGLCIMLDRLSDPGNLGTVIRCADAFGVEKLWLGEGCADVYGPKTVRAAMGSVFRVPTEYCVLPEKIAELKAGGFGIYAAMLDESSQSAEKLDGTGKLGFVIGNEGTGVSDEVRAVCSGSVMIPMRKNGAESLNASVAAAILMWEYRKI